VCCCALERVWALPQSALSEVWHEMTMNVFCACVLVRLGECVCYQGVPCQRCGMKSQSPRE